MLSDIRREKSILEKSANHDKNPEKIDHLSKKYNILKCDRNSKPLYLIIKRERLDI